MRKRRSTTRRGFTLVETILAIGIVAVAVLPLIGLLLTSRDAGAEAALRSQANRLGDAVAGALRKDGTTALGSQLAAPPALLAVYQIRVDPALAPGTEPASADLRRDPSGGHGQSGGYLLRTVVRRAWVADEAARWDAERDAVEGSALLVEISGESSAALQATANGDVASEPVLVVVGRFHSLPTGLPSARWPIHVAGRRPVLSIPFAIRP